MKLMDILYAVASPLAFASDFFKNRTHKLETEAPEHSIPTTKEGTVIPVLFGTRDIESPVLGWYGNLRNDTEQPGDGTDYYISALFILAHGKIEKMTRISYGDRIIWSGEITSGSSRINGNNLFEDSSCLSGKFYFDNGKNTDVANEFLSTATGFNVKYNGFSHVILEDNYIGKAPSLKAPKFRVYGKPCENPSFDTSGALEKIQGFTTLVSVNVYNDSESFSGWDKCWEMTLENSETPETSVTFSYDFEDTSRPEGTYEVGIIFTKGLTAGEIETKIESDNLDVLLSFPTYQISGNLDINPSEFWQSGNFSKCGVYLVARIANHDPTFSTPVFSAQIEGTLDANPAHILYACLTSKIWSFGYESYAIHDGSFLAAAETLKNEESFGLSFLWAESSKIEDIVNEVLRHVDGVLYLDRGFNRFHFNLLRKTENVAGLVELNTSNIIEVSNYTRGTLEDVYNAVNVSFYNTQLGDASGVSVSDVAVAIDLGITRTKTLDFPALSNFDTARLVAKRELKRASTIQETATIIANYDAQNLNIGDAFVVNYPKYWDAPFVMRVLRIDFGNGSQNKITIDAIKEWM